MSAPITIAWAPNGRDLMLWPAGLGYAVEQTDEERSERVKISWAKRRKAKLSAVAEV